jgi:hypothetical protein
MKIKAVIPRDLGLDPRRLQRAITNGLDASAKAAKVDFGVTTQTWAKKPDFEISEPDPYSRVIGTDDEIYGYVNDGTKPHLIVARNGKALAFGVPSGAKTTPRVIGSSAGRKGSTMIRRKAVQHPGTDAREFDQAIAEKWENQLPTTMQRAIDSEIT